MAEDVGQSRTEAPTPRRREEAREQGQVAFSPELASALVLLAGVGVLSLGARAMGTGLLDCVRLDLLGSYAADLTVEQAQGRFAELMGRGVEVTGLLLGLLFLAGVAAGTLQIGFRLAPQVLALNWERLSPTHGAGRMSPLSGGVRTLLIVLKLAAVALVGYWVLKGRVGEIASLQGGTLAGAVTRAWGLIMRLALALAGTLAVLGVLDYGWRRWRLEQSLMMTRQEVKEELKRDEGDPQVKARVRKLQREAAKKRMFREVPRATVVITNPTHLAIALRYDRATMAAPRVVAKGAGFVAQRIVELARRHAVPVVERKPVAQALFKAVKVDQDIPAALYQAIAEVLAYVYRLRGAA